MKDSLPIIGAQIFITKIISIREAVLYRKVKECTKALEWERSIMHLSTRD